MENIERLATFGSDPSWLASDADLWTDAALGLASGGMAWPLDCARVVTRVRDLQAVDARSWLRFGRNTGCRAGPFDFRTHAKALFVV